MSKLLDCSWNIRLDWKGFFRSEHSSLFVLRRKKVFMRLTFWEIQFLVGLNLFWTFFPEFSPDFFGIFPDFPDFFGLILDFSAFSRIFSGFFQIFPDFSGFSRIFPDFPGFSRIFPDFPWIFCWTINCHRYHQGATTFSITKLSRTASSATKRSRAQCY